MGNSCLGLYFAVKRTGHSGFGGGGASSCWGEECEKCNEDAKERYDVCKEPGKNSCGSSEGQRENKCFQQYMVDLQVCKTRGGQSISANGSW